MQHAAPRHIAPHTADGPAFRSFCRSAGGVALMILAGLVTLLSLTPCGWQGAEPVSPCYNAWRDLQDAVATLRGGAVPAAPVIPFTQYQGGTLFYVTLALAAALLCGRNATGRGAWRLAAAVHACALIDCLVPFVRIGWHLRAADACRDAILQGQLLPKSDVLRILMQTPDGRIALDNLIRTIDAGAAGLDAARPLYALLGVTTLLVAWQAFRARGQAPHRWLMGLLAVWLCMRTGTLAATLGAVAFYGDATVLRHLSAILREPDGMYAAALPVMWMLFSGVLLHAAARACLHRPAKRRQQPPDTADGLTGADYLDGLALASRLAALLWAAWLVMSVCVRW